MGGGEGGLRFADSLGFGVYAVAFVGFLKELEVLPLGALGEEMTEGFCTLCELDGGERFFDEEGSCRTRLALLPMEKTATLKLVEDGEGGREGLEGF